MRQFEGAITAIITPFTKAGEFDKKAFEKMIEFQIDQGIDGIVPCGTTGESPTLTHSEHDEVIKYAVQIVDGRVPVIAGTGSNSTIEAITLSKHAQKSGADALLQVVPYYNKPTQEGLFQHFSAIARACDLPIIVYNILGRSGVNMETATLARLAEEYPHITGVKEASGDLAQMKDVLETLPKDFSVLSGDDNLTIQLMEMGGAGVISVASNLIPADMHLMTQSMLNGNTDKAIALGGKYAELFKVLFIESNPQPIKTALAWQGHCEEEFRLPMVTMQENHKEQLKSVLGSLNLI